MLSSVARSAKVGLTANFELRLRPDKRMVKFLLRHGAPKSLPDNPEWATPLAGATTRGHDEIARLLS